MKRALCVALAIVATAAPARAHELRPGFLELKERASGTYDFLWKRPVGAEAEEELVPVIPEGCAFLSPDAIVPGALLARGTLRCDGGLAGKTLTVAGLSATTTDVLVRVEHADGRVETHLLRPAAPSVTLGESGGTGVWPYLRLGMEHILLGVDHLLFVLGLLLIVKRRWMLVKTISAFTLAHSITLAVATLGYARAPLPPLNAAIALSILFLGPEIVRTWRGETSFTIRHPWVVAFSFGLLHGFGFASGLSTAGIPRSEVPLALLLFNLGVEAGQILFVLLVIRLERSFRILDISWPRLVRALPGYAVGLLGAFWTIQRVALLLGLLLLVLWPATASAHVGSVRPTGFLSGFRHPISGLDHVLAMVSVGLWGAQLGAPAMWLLPVLFPLVMAVGGFLGLAGVPLPGVEIGIALSAVLLGLCVLSEARPPLWLAALLVGSFAVFHGHAHGTELPAGESGLLYSMGFVMATGSLHAVGITLGLTHRWSWGRWALRGAGAVVALGGAIFLWRALS